MGRIRNTINGLKPVVVMLVVQTSMAWVNIFYKLVMNDGMSIRVLTAYRFLLASAFVVPLALIVERKRRPKMTWVVASQGFVCGFLGASMSQNLYAQSLALTSATFAAAMTNLVPAFTFILAISFGLERMSLGTIPGKAKMLGTTLCIGGAMLLTFYKGAEINLWSTNVDLLHKGQNKDGHVAKSQQEAGNHQALGALLLVCCCLSNAMALIVQAKMIKNYPCPYSTTAMIISAAGIQAVVYALCMERDWTQWKMGWNIRLLTVAYSGIVVSGIMYIFMSWCVKMRGPLFVSVFKPAMLVIVAISSSLVLDERLHLGSVEGALVIVFGLYMVLWGKSKEMKISQLLLTKRSTKESQPTEIIVIRSSSSSSFSSSSSTQNNNNNITTNSNVNGIAPNNIAVVCSDDALDKDISAMNNIKEGNGGGISKLINVDVKE